MFLSLAMGFPVNEVGKIGVRTEQSVAWNIFQGLIHGQAMAYSQGEDRCKSSIHGEIQTACPECSHNY